MLAEVLADREAAVGEEVANGTAAEGGGDLMKTWLQQAEERGLIVSEQGVNTAAITAAAGNSLKIGELPAGISEALFQKKVIALAQANSWRVAHFRKVRVQRRNGTTFWETPISANGKGFLDLELVRDRLVKVELKVGKNQPTKEQREWLAAYEQAGVECYVWWPKDWQDIVKTLTRAT